MLAATTSRMPSVQDVHGGMRLVAGRRRSEQRRPPARAKPPPMAASWHRVWPLSEWLRAVLFASPPARVVLYCRTDLVQPLALLAPPPSVAHHRNARRTACCDRIVR